MIIPITETKYHLKWPELSLLQAIKKRLGWSERGKINETLKRINRLQKELTPNEEGVRLIYNLLHGINSELEQWENDKKWSA